MSVSPDPDDNNAGASEQVDLIRAGDPGAILAAVQLACPGWNEQAAAAIEVKPVTGGMSGAALFLVSAAAADPPRVIVRVASPRMMSPVKPLRAFTPGCPAHFENAFMLEHPSLPGLLEGSQAAR